MYSARDLRNENMALLRRLHRQREQNSINEYEKQKKKLDKERELFNMKQKENGNENGLNPFKGFDLPFVNFRNMKKKESRADYNRGFSRLGLYLNRRGI